MSDEKDTKKEETTEDKQQTTEDKKKSDTKAEREETKEKEKKVENTDRDDSQISQTEDKKEKKTEKIAIPDLKPGMTVRVYQKIKELNAKGEEKERIQYFEGLIIAKKHGKEAGGTITVRKISDGVGVEKIFPLNLPTIDRIEIKKQARVRRAKLYFLKNFKKPFRKKLKEIKISK